MIENLEYAYCNDNFETRAIGSSSTTNNVKDALTRFRNALVTAFRKYNCIPKIIVFIPEDDIIKAINKSGFGVGTYYDTAIDWLLDEFQQITKTFLKYTPQKVRKGKKLWPYFLWMSPSLHDNYEETNHQQRKKFTQSLEKAVKNRDRTIALRFKTVWNPRDLKLFSFREKRFTAQGWKIFWQSVDKSIQFMDTKIIPELQQDNEERSRNVFRNSQTHETTDNEHKPSNTVSKHWARDRLHHGQPSSHRRSYDTYHYRRDGYKLPPPPERR